LLIAAAALSLQLTEHRDVIPIPDPQPPSKSRAPRFRTSGDVFDDFHSGLDLDKKWQLIGGTGSDPSAMIIVQNDKLHLHTGRFDSWARLETRPPYREYKRISIKLSPISLNGSDSSINLIILDEQERRKDSISMYTVGGEQALFNFMVSGRNHKWTAPFPIEKGREYVVEAAARPRGFHFTVTGPDMIEYTSEYGYQETISNFRLEVVAVTAPPRLPSSNPHRHFYVDMDEIRITYA
jgi:hypothetical protein